MLTTITFFVRLKQSEEDSSTEGIYVLVSYYFDAAKYNKKNSLSRAGSNGGGGGCHSSNQLEMHACSNPSPLFPNIAST